MSGRSRFMYNRHPFTVHRDQLTVRSGTDIGRQRDMMSGASTGVVIAGTAMRGIAARIGIAEVVR